VDILLWGYIENTAYDEKILDFRHPEDWITAAITTVPPDIFQ
jgi:hypothetical protein